MQKVIGVRLKKAGKIHYFKPGQVEIKKGDFVIVDTAQGIECAEVVIAPRDLANDKFKIEFIRRKANAYDLNKVAENKSKSKEAFDICRQKIAEHNLPMNLIGVEYSFDMSKIVFSFTAAGRVDFRELVKDLASIFHMRIELHQVGVRDEAKFMGGIGCCGRSLCCATFLGDFIPVSIRMAKEQNLSLNPSKISGICGRLMCCLKFENDYYCERYSHEAIKEPKLGDRVIVDEGEGKIISLNQHNKTATIILDNSKTIIAPFDNIFEAESSVEEGQTIIATVKDDDEERTPTTKSEAYKSDRWDKLSQRNSRRLPPTKSNLSTGKPAYQSKPAASSTSKSAPPSRSSSSSQNKSSSPSQTKPNYRGRDKDNRKSSKRGRRGEDYQRNKKFRPRRPEVDEED